MERLETALVEVGANAVLRAADGHRRGGRRQVPSDPRVRGPRLVRGTEPGPARPLPALRRRCHVLADPRDRPERRRHQRRGSAGGGARQDRARRSQRRRRRGRPARRRRPGRRGDRAVHRAVPGAGAVLGDPQAARGDRQPSAARGHRGRHPRRRSDVPGADRSPARGRPGGADPDPRLRPPRAAGRARRVGRDARGVADHARAAVPGRGRFGRRPPARRARRVRAQAHPGGRRGQSPVRRADHLHARRDRRGPPGWRRLGGDDVVRGSGHPADGRGTGRRPPRCPRAGRARRHRPGLGDRPRLRGRGRRPSRPGGGRGCGPGAPRDADRQAARAPDGREADFYRFGHAVIKDAAYRSLLKRDRADLHVRFVEWAEPVNRERGRELEFEEILGYHLEQAYRYRVELGPLDATERRRRPSGGRQAGLGRPAGIRPG